MLVTIYSTMSSASSNVYAPQMVPSSIEESAKYDPSKSRLVTASSSAIPQLPPGAQYCIGKKNLENPMGQTEVNCNVK